MRIVHVTGAKGAFELVKRESPEPGPGSVRVKVEACGIWKAEQRAGVGCHGGHCGYCNSCRRGDFMTCEIAPQIPGISHAAATPTP